MKRICLVLVMMIFIKVMSAQSSLFSIDSVAMVDEGVISSKDFEFNFTVTADEGTAFFSKALLPDWRRMSIVYTQKKKGRWQSPVLAPFSGVYRDADPFIAPNQERLYFISDRPSKYQKKKADYSFWYVKAPFEKATEPILLEGDFYAQFASNPVYPSVSQNGNLYFSAVDSTGDSDIYVVHHVKSRYGLATKLSFNQPNVRDLDPVIAPDESFILFASPSRKGLGGSDLYISFQRNGQWTEPENLGSQINTPGNEGQVSISSNGKTIFFSSIRNTSLPDYQPRTRKLTREAFEKELLSPINGLPNIWKAELKISAQQ